MELISSIFDDKRVQKNKLQGQIKKKVVTSTVKARRTTKSNVTDKKVRTTPNRSISQNDKVKDGGNKGDVRKSTAVPQKRNIDRNETAKKENANNDSSDTVLVGKEIKEVPAIDPAIIRNSSKYFEENDSIESSFESALEVYNDCTFDEKDAEFGRESFKSLDQDYFIEAYNKEGYELLQTSIQLSFDTAEFVPEDSIKVPSEGDDQIIFASDDDHDADKTFIETYNSIGYELRKIHLENQGDEPESSSVQKSSCSPSRESTPSRFDSTNSTHSSASGTSRKSLSKTENVIKRQLQQQESIEEPSFEIKSIHELVMETNSPAFDVADVKRSASSTSKKSTLSRFDSTSSAGSYTLATGSLKKYDDSVDIDDDLPTLKLSFEVKTKADMIIQELLETEYNYIENLIKIKKDYIRYFKRMRINSAEMFGNILEILNETKDFYSSLQVCGNDCEYIGNTFKDYKHLFELYPEYSKNKSNADLLLHKRFKPILQERQKFLGDKLDLASYLLNPVQRLGRYILLLKTLQKSIRKPECLEEALKLVEQSMKKGNDYVAIDSILKCEIDLTTKGSYVDREKFILLKPKREEIVLFLFDQIVVFTCQEPNTEKFFYKSSIYVDDLQIINSEGDDNQVFQLKNYTKSKKENQDQHTYILEARSVKLREMWVQLIQNRLWQQLQQVKAKSKTYKIPDNLQKKQTKSIANPSNSVKAKSANAVQKRSRTASDRNSVKRNSKFYVEEINSYDTL